MQVIPPIHASESSLLSFHSTNYIEFLQKVDEHSDFKDDEEGLLEFGLGVYLFHY
jgi:acetoin utilization deacetylase AcuC-like enzyme